MSLTFSPIEELSITASGAVQSLRARTKAEHAASGRVPNFDGDTAYWALDVTYDPTKKLSLSTGVTRQVANSIFPYQSTEVYAGVTYKISKIWSADFKYTYVVFDEHGNGNIDDFDGNMFSFGLVANFE